MIKQRYATVFFALFTLPLIWLATVNAIEKPSAGDAADRILVNSSREGVALEGHDPVAYFTDSKAVMGDPELRASYKGAIYQFASVEHKAMFESDPAHYAPQYGGFCGYAVSINRISPVDPTVFQIVDGRLVLQNNKKALELWNKDVPGNIVKADNNWPGLVQKNGIAGKTLINVDQDGVAIQGYDPIAYFTDGKPMKGDPAIKAVYNQAKYYFVSQAHREVFERAPARYAPSFGGFCAYAASKNRLVSIDPMVFQITNERLLLQYSPEAYELFNESTRMSLASADKNWPGLVEHSGH